MSESVARLRTLLLACALTAPAAARATAATAGEPAVHPDPEAATERFELWNEPSVNLHHFLIHWAAADSGERPPWAAELVERAEGLDALTPEEREAWSLAVEAYRSGAVGRSLVFDGGLIALRDHLVGRGTLEAVPPDDRGLAEAVGRALPVYRRHWWERHRAENRRWISELVPTLREVEGAMARRVAAAYGGRWPEERIPIDVVAYASFVGAYSTGGRLTIASGDPDLQMPQSVELVFHESSHVDPLEAPLRGALEEAFRAEGAEPPDRLWHDLIFFTTGELTGAVLAEMGTEGYRPYGETAGVYARGERWPPQLRAFERHWRPFLEAGSADPDSRRTALRAVARQLRRP